MRYQIRKFLLTAVMLGIVFAFVPKTDVMAVDFTFTNGEYGSVNVTNHNDRTHIDDVYEIRETEIIIKDESCSYCIDGDFSNFTLIIDIDALSFESFDAVIIDSGAKIESVKKGNSNDDYCNIGDNWGEIGEVNSGVAIRNNYGKIIFNKGYISSNTREGEVEGKVEINNGTIQQNFATVDMNRKTIDENYGTVKNNDSDGIINNNAKEYAGSSFSSIVENNKGIINTNYSEITNNEGTVDTNKGKISSNTGRVSNNSEGKVYNNSGTVNGGGFVSTDPEPEGSKRDDERRERSSSSSKKDDDKPAPTENQVMQDAIFSSIESQLQSISLLSDDVADDSTDRIIKIDGEDKIYSLPQKTMAMIAANPNVTVSFTYIYNGVKYETIIPAGAEIDPTIEWFGPIYLMYYYPTTWIQPGADPVPVIMPIK